VEERPQLRVVESLMQLMIVWEKEMQKSLRS
jgi:hypothetical protein